MTIEEQLRESLARKIRHCDEITEERDKALRERDEARREADRFRHGCTVEGDFVCPNEYAVSELTAERNFLRALKKNHEEDFARICKERDEARAELATLADALDDIRHQRDRYHVELKQERQEVERLREALEASGEP